MTQDPPTPQDARLLRDQHGISIRSNSPKHEQIFLSVGQTVGKYRILAEVDRGGMAVVYRALQLDLQREVALKVIPATVSINPRFLERFLAEAHAVSKLNHPSIVAIHEVAHEGGIYFIAMDYIPGHNLSQYLHERKPKLVEVLSIISSIAEALAYAHRQRIIHRDLKLNNVIMKDDTTPVVIDFGLAKALEEDESNITRTGELVGSPAYMAPERIVGGLVDHRSDICSLGIMLYEMLTFKNPYLDPRSIHQTTMNVIEAAPLSPRRLVPWLPSEVEAVTLKAMHADPSRRYQSMEEFQSDIIRYQRGEFVLAQPPSLYSRLSRFIRKRWPYLAILGLIVVFSLILGATLMAQSARGRAHWKLAHQLRLSGNEAVGWTAFRNGVEDTSAWLNDEGHLSANAPGRSWLRLNAPVTRDVRIEATIVAHRGALNNIGVFLYGDAPEEGYQFYLYHGAQGAHGMVFPGSKLYIREPEAQLNMPGPSHQIEIERRQRQIVFKVDGVVISRAWDLFPPAGPRHQYLGLFAEAGAFEHVRVYQLAIPLAPGPTLLADRLFERGDFQAALEEYRALTVDFAQSDLARELHLRIFDCLIRLGRADEALAGLQRGPLIRFVTDAAQSEAMFLTAMANEHLGRTDAADSVLLQICARFPATPAGWSAGILVTEHGYRISRGDTLNARSHPPLDTLAILFPRFWPHTLSAQRRIVETWLERGMIDSALSAARRMVAVYGRDNIHGPEAFALLSRVLLGKREIQEAVDILNRCVASHTSSSGVWQAWMLLASVYDYEQSFRDALIIYRKVSRECPPGNYLRWMARIRMAELALKSGHEESPLIILRDVSEGAHPFVLPRAIAQFYQGSIGATQLTDLWHQYYPGDWYFLYYLARKALMDSEPVIAGIYLQQLLAYTQPATWRYLSIYQMLSNLDRY